MSASHPAAVNFTWTYNRRSNPAIALERDEGKRQGNLAKHGIDFRTARELFDGRPAWIPRSLYPQEARHGGDAAR